MPRQYSTWAWSAWRVRSPIQIMWPEVAYQSPDVESTRVRLLGIDTPEISPEPDCWGSEATAKLTALVPPGSTIWVAPDAEVHDQYGRTLLYVWTPDGRFVNGELVAQGDARVEIYSPNRSQEALLRSLESAAVAADAGRWGACG